MIGHEKGVELSGLQFLRESLDVREIEIRVGEGARVPPRAGVNTDRAHERAEPEFSCVAGIHHVECVPPLIDAEPCLLEEWDDAVAEKFEIGGKIEKVNLYPVAARLFQF